MLFSFARLKIFYFETFLKMFFKLSLRKYIYGSQNKIQGVFLGDPTRKEISLNSKKRGVFLHIFGAQGTENVNFAVPMATLMKISAIFWKKCCLKCNKKQVLGYLGLRKIFRNFFEKLLLETAIKSENIGVILRRRRHCKIFVTTQALDVLGFFFGWSSANFSKLFPRPPPP